ncbi:hypothetical protein CFE53_00960 [Methanofervidicoccus sp. A16]|uniref:DUF2206 domain-containing protein n=1 Tax=Methanofervidicoccus sp. A16 TaxID=2607662 RepID=UPI00118A7901|nr:DUF2206 domain-containing protein [Methanofervidicoccus sp. A16]AXI24807.1 hypothetical protein CFE53_00960 [Methanofervidicoccus sp. A16]
MYIKNPFRLNDWDIKSFLTVVLSILLVYLGVVVLDKLDIQIPLLRQIFGFIYLTFIPGYLLLRILRIHDLSSGESFLYAIGLSLFLDMFVGFLMNMFYPLLGITDKPIAEIPIILTMTLVVGILSIVAYIRDKDYENPGYILVEDIINPQVLFLSLIPFIAIFGTYLVNYYNNNILLILMIVLIALISLIIGFTNWIDEKYYPYAIWVMAISLILHRQLISETIIINDCVGEFYLAKNIISLGYWPWYECTKVVPGTYNSVLSVTILPTIFYYILNTSLNWIYKLILPSFCSLLPISIYVFTKNITNNRKLSFLSAFLFISTAGYLIKITVITKQLLAQLYVLLIIIAFLNSKIKLNIKKLVLSIFGFSLVVSHYATTYIIIASTIFTLIFLKIWRWIFSFKNNKMEKVLITFLEILIILTVGWYIYISQSISFKSFLDFVQSIWAYEIFDTYDSRVLYTVTVKLSSGITDHIIKLLYVVLSFFIFIGYIDKLYINIVKKKTIKEKHIFLLGFSGFWLLLLISAVVLPSITSSFDPIRLYQTSLLVLCIFSIVGIKKIVNILYIILKKLKNIKIHNIDYIKISSIFFILLLIFPGTFLVNELINDNPRSISLSKEKILNNSLIKPKIGYFQKVIPIENIVSGKWIGKYGDYKDVYRFDLVQGYPSLLLYGDVKGNVYTIAKGRILDNGNVSIHYDLPKNNSVFIHLTYQNLVYSLYWTWYNPLQVSLLYNYSDIKPIIINALKVYDNGKSQVYLYHSNKQN